MTCIGEIPGLPVPSNIPSNMKSDSAARLITGWLSACAKHSKCRLPFATSDRAIDPSKSSADASSHSDSRVRTDTHPKRLIWLGNKQRPPRLVSYSSDHDISYAALSYCWGGDENFKTEQHTLQDFCNEIPVDRLPQTLKDAFDLTKRIGLEYLWVDAVCIVQGNQREREEESRKMGDIYSNARIVLSATRSKHVNEGMFLSRSTTSLAEDIASEDGSLHARRNHNHEIIISCRSKSDR